MQLILIEGVADRDWGITFSVVNGRINKQKFLSDPYFTQKVISGILATLFAIKTLSQGQLIAVGESQRKRSKDLPRELYSKHTQGKTPHCHSYTHSCR